MKTIILLLFSLGFCFSVVNAQSIQLSEQTSIFYSGEIGAETWYFPKKAPVASFPKNVNTIKGKLNLTFLFDAPLEIRFTPRFQFDADDENRNRLEIEDLFIDYFTDNFEIRAGLQIFSWKTVESISHADFLNQTDLESDFLDAQKFSELAVRFRYIPDTDIEQLFEIYYLPYMRGTRFPVENNRFSFGLNISNNSKDHIYQDENKEWRPQFALSYSRTFWESLDTRFFYFNGYNRFPGFVPTDLSFSNFVHQYRLIQKGGLAFQGVIESWLVKGEMAQTTYTKKVQNQLGQLIKPSFFAYTVGFEYSFYSPFIENHDLGTIVEVIGDTDSGKDASELESFRPFQNHLFGGLRYTFNNTSDRSFLAGGFYNYKDGDLIMSLEYSERFFENFTAKLSYLSLTSDTDPLKNFEHTDRLIFELLFNF
ncbi:MAG: hypothetical protein D8M58_05450 [Calditrichaeota bacterium]|nr:MAG: hypothetical protein DWQ03_21055 [Calditrichota bacterium]MBL1204821.1 hypothetical protein [Calditrichota bacterium]NOG44650.1 hypothetical protein [Calditrichota bacterium]